MARRQLIISDLTGNEADETEAVQIVFRRGNGLERPVVVDALATEVTELSEASDVYLIEVKPFAGETREMIVTTKELSRLVADGDLIVLLGKSARPTRGRPPLTRR